MPRAASEARAQNAGSCFPGGRRSPFRTDSPCRISTNLGMFPPPLPEGYPGPGLVVPVQGGEHEPARSPLAKHRLAHVPLDADLGGADPDAVVDDVAQKDPAGGAGRRP